MTLFRISEFDFIQKRKKIAEKLHECNSWSTCILTIDGQLIHYYQAYVLVPKFLNHSLTAYTKMQLLYAIKNNHQVNWPYVILHHMENQNEFSKGLPYDYFISIVFRRCNMNITNDNRVEMHLPEYHITPKLCNSKMGVQYDPISKTIKYIDYET
ncbi:hypothetical protein KIW84_022057 [Lathyrus oleraceus]|uniref:Uncharacterized protein n=1 Tax=Pisum sativum TaxID=3888 RepID=A0A9D4Y9T5_PEA|nr:hypothetical protein KIW84_022057 [Pisum sativum]